MSEDEIKNQTAVRNFSEEGLEAVTNNLKPQIKHSYHYFKRHPNRVAISCSLCPFNSQCEYSKNPNGDCVPVLEYQKEIVEEIFSLPHIRPQDKYLVYRFAHIQARLMVIDRWLNDISGNFQITEKSITVQPITRARNEDEKTLIKLSDKLCLSPDARSRVGLNIAQTYSLAMALSELEYDKN
jgi:hypothetical protein